MDREAWHAAVHAKSRQSDWTELNIFFTKEHTLETKHINLAPKSIIEYLPLPPFCCSALSRVRLFATPWTAARQVSLPSPSPGTCSNSCPLSQWCHPTISSSVVPFPSRLQSFPASGSFLISQLFTSGGQSIGPSASASVLPMNTQDWFSSGRTGWISLQFKGLSRVFSNTTVQKRQFFGTQPSLWSNSHPYMTTGKTIALTRQTFVSKVMSLLFNMLSSFDIAFLPRSKCLLISWLQSPSAVILEPPPQKKNLPLFTLFPHLSAIKWWVQMPWS